MNTKPRVYLNVVVFYEEGTRLCREHIAHFKIEKGKHPLDDAAFIHQLRHSIGVAEEWADVIYTSKPLTVKGEQ